MSVNNLYICLFNARDPLKKLHVSALAVAVIKDESPPLKNCSRLINHTPRRKISETSDVYNRL